MRSRRTVPVAFSLGRGDMHNSSIVPMRPPGLRRKRDRCAALHRRVDAGAGRSDAYIQTLEVAPEQRGHGVGGELLRLIEGSARAAGAQLIWFHVDAENAGAIRLYEGTATSSRQGRDYYAKGRAALIYGKPLESGTAD